MTLGCAAAAAHADSITDYVHLELGAGASRYSAQGDNTWYQQGMEHDLGLSAPVLMLGFTGPVYTRESWGIDWHIDYVSLGHVSSQCECTPVDADYSVQTHTLINPIPVDVPNSNFVGNGNAQGIALTVEPYVMFHEWRLGIAGGLFPYRPEWSLVVYNWSDQPGQTPQTLHVSTPRAWQIGKVVGLSVERRNFGVSYQHYWLPTKFDDTHAPAIWKGADIVMLTYKF